MDEIDDLIAKLRTGGKSPTLSEDEDYAVRTIIGEAKNEGEKGWEAVADVIRNRSKQSGKRIKDVVLAPSQFEPWSSRRKELESYDPNSKIFQRVAQTTLPVLRGERTGPAANATHFYSPGSQAALGRKPPSWDNGKGFDVGSHRFFNFGYGGKGKHGIGRQDDVDGLIQQLRQFEQPDGADNLIAQLKGAVDDKPIVTPTPTVQGQKPLVRPGDPLPADPNAPIQTATPQRTYQKRDLRNLRDGEQFFKFEQTGEIGDGLSYLGISEGKHYAKDADGDEFELEVDGDSGRWKPLSQYPARLKFGETEYKRKSENVYTDAEGDEYEVNKTAEGGFTSKSRGFPKKLKFGEDEWVRTGEGKYKDPKSVEYFIEKTDDGFSVGDPVIDKRTPKEKQEAKALRERFKASGLSLEEFNKTLDAESVEGANRENKVSGGSAGRDRQVRPQVNAPAIHVEQPPQTDTYADEVFDTPLRPGSGANDVIDDLAGKVAEKYKVDYDVARSILAKENWNVTDINALLKDKQSRGETHQTTLGGGAIRKIIAEDKAYKERKERYEAQLARYNSSLNPDEPTSVNELRAARDIGILSEEDAEKKIAEEIDLYKRLRKERETVINDPDAAAIATVSGGNTRDADNEFIDRLLKQYGSLSAYKKEQDRLKEEYKYRPLAHPIEFAKSLYGAVPKAVASLLKTADIALNLHPLKTAVQGELKMDETALSAVGDAINQYIESSKNKDFDPNKNPSITNFMLTVLPDTLGQMGVQIAAGVLTGGASVPTLIGASMGAAGQYDEAKKYNATDKQKLLSALVGGLAAAPDAILFGKWFKGASAGEKAGFFQKLGQSLTARLGVKFGDDVAKEVVDGALPRIAKNILKGSGFEGTQEVLENKVNDLLASKTYDTSPERKAKITSWTDEDTWSFIGGAIGGGVAGGVMSKVDAETAPQIESKVDELLTKGEITPEQAQKINDAVERIKQGVRDKVAQAVDDADKGASKEATEVRPTVELKQSDIGKGPGQVPVGKVKLEPSVDKKATVEIPPAKVESSAVAEVSGDTKVEKPWKHGTTTGELNYEQESPGNQLPYGVHFTQDDAIATDFASGATKGKATGNKGQVIEASINAPKMLDVRRGVYYEGAPEYDILNQIGKKARLRNYISAAGEDGTFYRDRKPEHRNAIDPSHVLDRVKGSVVKAVLQKNGYDAAIKYSMRSSRDPLGSTPVYTEAIAVLDPSLVSTKQKPLAPDTDATTQDAVEPSPKKDAKVNLESDKDTLEPKSKLKHPENRKAGKESFSTALRPKEKEIPQPDVESSASGEVSGEANPNDPSTFDHDFELGSHVKFKRAFGLRGEKSENAVGRIHRIDLNSQGEVIYGITFTDKKGEQRTTTVNQNKITTKPVLITEPELREAAATNVATDATTQETGRAISPAQSPASQAREERRAARVARREEAKVIAQPKVESDASSDVSGEAQVEPWRMTRPEIDAALGQAKNNDANLLTDLFGEQGAKQYRRLQARANSAIAPMKDVDAAYKKVEAMEAALSEAQRNRLYGIGETGPQIDDLKDYQQALNAINGDTEAELGRSLKYAITRVNGKTDPAEMNHSEQVAYAQIRHAFEIAKEKGFDTQKISETAVKAASERWNDPADLELMLGQFLGKPKRSKRLSETTNVATDAPTQDTEAQSPEALRSVPKSDPLDGIITKDGISYEQVKDVARRVESGELEIRRIDPAGERGRVEGGRKALEATILLATDEARRQEVSQRSGADVESRRSAQDRQEHLLEYAAKATDSWYDWTTHFGKHRSFDRGGEAFVYRKGDNHVFKTVDYRHIDRGLTPLGYLDNRIGLFNTIFPGTKYELVGFTRDHGGKFRFVVKQPFIDVHGISQAEVTEYMRGKGFEKTARESYANNIYSVHDLHQKNVTKDADGTIYVIDAVPKLNEGLLQPFEVVEKTEPLRSVPQTETDAFKKGVLIGWKDATGLGSRARRVYRITSDPKNGFAFIREVTKAGVYHPRDRHASTALLSNFQVIDPETFLHPEAFSPDDPSILRKRPESSESLEKLKTAYLDDILPDAESTYKGENVVKLNPEAGEVVRTALAFMQKTERGDQALIGALFNEPIVAEKLIATLEGMEEGAIELDIDAKNIRDLIGNFEKAAKKDGTVILDVIGGLEHEQVHYASWKGADGKKLVDRYANIDVIARDKDFKTFWGALNDLQGNSSIGVAAEEALAYLGSGDYARFGLTEAQAVGILQKLVSGYAEANGVESLKNFEAEKIYEAVENYRKGQSSEASNDGRGEVGEEREAGSGTSKEKPDKVGPGERQKVAAFSRILGQDYYYDPQGHDETERRAQQLLSDKGTEQAVFEALNGKPSAETMRVVYFELERLNGLADHYLESGNNEAFNAAAQEIADLSSRIVARQVKTGQEVEIAKTLAPMSPEVAILAATRMKKFAEGDPDAKLSDVQAKQIVEIAKELKAANQNLAEANLKLKKAERKIKRLESDKEPSRRTPQARLLKEYQQKKPDLLAKLREAFPNSPVFNGKESALRMVAGGALRSVPVSDLDAAQEQLLTEYAAGMILEGHTYDNVIQTLTDIAGTDVRHIHASAVETLKPTKGMSDETKTRLQARQEHYRKAEEFTNPNAKAERLLKSIEKRLKNQIAELEREIETGVDEKGEKLKVTSPEVEALKRERDDLQTRHDEIFPKEEKAALTPVQRVKRAEAALERSIADLEKQLKDGRKDQKTPLPESDRLRELRAMRATLAAKLKDSTLSGIAQDAQDQGHSPEIVFAVDRLTGEKPKNINDVIKDIRDKFNLDVHKATDIARQARQAVKEIKAARSQERDEAKAITPELREELNEAKIRRARATYRLNKFLNQLAHRPWLMERFNNDFRAKLVSNWATQIFNAVQGAISTSVESVLDLMEATIKTVSNPNPETTLDINAKDTWLPLAYVFSNNKKLAEQALAEFPEEYYKVHSGLLGDIELETPRLAPDAPALTKPGHWWFDKNDQVNKWLSKVSGAKMQEMHFRNAIVASSFDQVVRKKSGGKETLKTAIDNGTLTTYITERDAKIAADKALRVTFAALIDDPIGRRLKHAYDQMDKILPVLLNPVTYARFTYTTTKVMVANPLLMGTLDSKTLGGEGYNARSIAKGVLGWSGVAMAYGILSAFGDDDDRWETITVNGTTLDVRRFFPMSSYFYVAHLIKSQVEGRPLPKPKELLGGFASLETDYFQYGAPMEMLDTLRGVYGGTKDASDVGASGARVLGGYFSGLLRFFKPMKDVLAQAYPEPMHDDSASANDKFFTELSKSLPFVSKAINAPVKEDVVTGKPITMPFPAGRLVGINVVHPTFLDPQPSPATEWAMRFFAFEGGGEFTPEERVAYGIKKQLKNAQRAGRLTPERTKAIIDRAVASGKLKKSQVDRLEDEMKLSELQARVKYYFGVKDSGDVKKLRRIWALATENEKADLRRVLRKKENRTKEFNAEFLQGTHSP